MSERIITGALLIVAIIHLLPLSGFAGVSRLSSLYGVEISDPNLEILMRHRSILFGVLGALFIYAAFQPPLQLIALIAGFVSVLSFFYLAYSVSGFNDAIQRVVIADVIALVALLIAAFFYLFQKGS